MANKRQVALKYGFRSGLEEDTAEDLTALGIDFTYEEAAIQYEKPARVSKYTPDFRVYNRPDGTPRDQLLIIETKGRFLTEDRQKMLLIKRQHPHLTFGFCSQIRTPRFPSNPKQHTPVGVRNTASCTLRVPRFP